MKHTIALLVSLTMLFGLGGCTVTKAIRLTDTQKFDALRTEAHQRGLRWRIFCTDSSAEHSFLAEAERDTPTEHFILYSEDGAQSKWREFGETQAEAAFNLYLSLKQNAIAPDEPMHKQSPKHKFCPPDISGN